MDSFLTASHLVGHSRWNTQTERYDRISFGLSLESTEPNVTRKNCWFMLHGLIRAQDLNLTNRTLLGATSLQVGSNHTWEPDSVITRAEFLPAMRTQEAEQRARGNQATCWVESNLRSFTSKPDLATDWPSLPGEPDRRRQVDIGTIGAFALNPEGEVWQVGDVYYDGTAGARNEIWVLSDRYHLSMPPGTNANPMMVTLDQSPAFASNPPTSAQDFLDRSYASWGQGSEVAVVNLGRSAIQADVPAA